MDIQGIEELANAANSISPMRDELKETRPKFEDLCMRLNVDEATSLRAWDYIAHLPNSEITPENERFWLTCALYIAGSRRFCSLVSGDSNAAGIGSLSQLLRASNIRLVDFFEPLKAFINLLQLGKPFEEQLKQVEKNFVVMCILFQKYEKLFDSLFHSFGDHVQERASKKKGSLENGIKTFGWSLFLICKGKLLQDPPDLVQAFHLLLCVINLLLTHVPAHMRKISFRDSQFINHSSDSESSAHNTLKYLCKVNNALEDEVTSMEKNFHTYIKSLTSKKILRHQPGPSPNDSILHTVYLGGLLDSFLQRNTQNVNQEYDLIHYNSGDLDERLFLEHSEQIGTPSRLSSQSRSYHNYRPPNTSEWDKQSGFASPLNKTAATPPHHPPQTPLTSAMSTLSWLKSTLNDRDDQPSTTLRRFFRASNPDPSAAIEARVKDMSDKLNKTVQERYATINADNHTDKNNNNNNNNSTSTTTSTNTPPPNNGTNNNNNNNSTSTTSPQDTPKPATPPNNGINNNGIKLRRSISISNDASNDSFASTNETSAPPSQQHSQSSEPYSQSQEDSQESIASQDSDGRYRLSRSQGSEFESQGSELLSQVSEPSSQGYEANSEASNSPPHDETNIIRSNSNMSDITSDVDTYMNIDEFSSGDEKESKKENEANTLANTLTNASSPPMPSPTAAAGPPLPIMAPAVRWMEEWEHRRAFIIRLYYKVLESILLAEEARLHTDNFATLLGHEFFHRSLFACSAEIVLYAYKMMDLAFPTVLRVFELSPFDFCKLIENVVRLETGLPRALVRHLGKIEEQILESFAWEEGSPVFTLLQQQQQQPGVRSTPKKTTMPPPSLAFASPVKGAKGAAAAGATKGTSLSLELFMRKVELLFTIRGQHLCANLQLPSAIFQQLWKTLVHAVSQEPTLTKNRHIDQILMASLYGVCRANQLNITFKSIIEKYSMQPQASSRIYREVLINPGEEKRSDIINFYNNVFIPVMQPFLLTLASETPSSSAPTPIITTPSKSAVPFSPMRTTRSPMPQHNIYVSPMTTRTAPRTHTAAHQSSAPNLLSSTPRTVLYNFGNNPRDLRQINAQINSPAPASALASPAPSHVSASPAHTRRAKRQLFDAEPQFLPNHTNAEVLETLENSLPPKRRLTLTDSSKSEGLLNKNTSNNNNENNTKNGKSSSKSDHENSNDEDNSDDSSSTTSTSTKSSPPPPSDISNVHYPSST